MSEFPEPDVKFCVDESFRTDRGTVRERVKGPFNHPDQARQARDQIRREDATRTVHCVEVRSYELPDPPVVLPTNEERISAIRDRLRKK